MQIERLVQMVFYIASHGHVTAQELANYFEVSTRTIYRDVNTLTLAGIPVTSAKGTGGGISLMEGYTIDKALLSSDDRQSIYQGLQILHAAKYPTAEITLNKIGALFKTVLAPKWLEVDFSYWGSDETEKVRISELQYAILNKHLIAFDYINSEHQRSRRTIEPLRLVFKSHAWYILGFCNHREDIRYFRMSRMRHIEVRAERFERELPPDFSPVHDSGSKGDYPVFKLRFSPEIAHRVFDEFRESQTAQCGDGCFIVTQRYELNHWIINYLLSFGKHVEVLEPKEARLLLKERAMDIAKIYE